MDLLEEFSEETVVIHNHPSLSKVSLQDVWLFIKYAAVKMIVVITNLGAIDYIVKTDIQQAGGFETV